MSLVNTVPTPLSLTFLPHHGEEVSGKVGERNKYIDGKNYDVSSRESKDYLLSDLVGSNTIASFICFMLKLNPFLQSAVYIPNKQKKLIDNKPW